MGSEVRVQLGAADREQDRQGRREENIGVLKIIVLVSSNITASRDSAGDGSDNATQEKKRWWDGERSRRRELGWATLSRTRKGTAPAHDCSWFASNSGQLQVQRGKTGSLCFSDSRSVHYSYLKLLENSPTACSTRHTDWSCSPRCAIACLHHSQLCSLHVPACTRNSLSLLKTTASLLLVMVKLPELGRLCSSIHVYKVT